MLAAAASYGISNVSVSYTHLVDCVAYESILLGAFEIFKGPHNRIAEELGVPKQCDITLGYSRDGFHFCRPDRTAFLKGSEKKGTWDYGYIHASGGLCIVEKDQLRFYYSAWSGESPKYLSLIHI